MPLPSTWLAPTPSLPTTACASRPSSSTPCATPRAISSQDFRPEKHQVLDPRISYVMTNMLEGVMNFGTAFAQSAAVASPLPLPARLAAPTMAGSPATPATCSASSGSATTTTATSTSAAPKPPRPIWAEFMKKAVALPQYADVKPFRQPTGVVDVQLDKATNRLATPACPEITPPPSSPAPNLARPATSPPALPASSRTSLVSARSLFPRPRMAPLTSPPPSTPTAYPKRKKDFLAKLRVSLRRTKRSHSRPNHRTTVAPPLSKATQNRGGSAQRSRVAPPIH